MFRFKNINKTKSIRIISFLSLSLFLFYNYAYAQRFVVIANPDAPSISQDLLRSLYLGFKTSLPDGTRAKVYVLKGDGVKERFFKEVLGITPPEFKSHWISRALAGEGTPPQELTAEEIIERVKSEKGAIGFIPAQLKPEGVKVILER